MVNSIAELREIARRCSLGQPLGEDLSKWLANSLNDFLAHRTRSIDDAFGLRATRGGVPWWRKEATRKRDKLLHKLAQTYVCHASISAQAREVHRMTLRYAATAWRFDRSLAHMPDTYKGTVNELLWSAFRSGATMPIGQRQLRNILGAGTTAD
jgi:hypothetical protein